MIEFSNEDIKYLALELPDGIKHYKYAADFRGEIKAIDSALEGNIPEALRHRLTIERVIAEGMCGDYTTDFDGLLSRIQKRYPACGKSELKALIATGQADHILKNGEMLFQNSAASNLMNEHELFLRRLSDPNAVPNRKKDEIGLENIKIMKHRGSRAFRYTVEERMSFDDGSVREGERVRVHFPFPAVCASQPESEIKLLGASHENVYISSSAQRTAFIETEYHSGDEFFVSFSYVNRAKYVSLDGVSASESQPAFCTEELYPHIRFTPLIKELAREIAGNERDNLRLARRVYDWITENIRYSYMREYLYIYNIPEFVALNRRGDCGAMSLLFITLCRYLGIPAKWESGSSVKFDYIGSHDWAMFYVAPLGWLYADLSQGEGARTRGNLELWDHLFGNLDPFRLVANTEVQASFDPPKRFMRIDPYDNQSGEAETDTRGLGSCELNKSRKVISFEEI